MHLAAQAHRGNLRIGDGIFPEKLLERQRASLPPVVRILLRPSIVGRGKLFVFANRRGEHLAFFADQDRARAARADVDANHITS